MSIDVMNKVIQRAPLSGSEFTCTLIMANWCNDEGNSLYPSIALLAEGMRVSRSQAQRVLHRLMPATPEDEAAGKWWFRVVGNEKGGAPGMTRRYEMNVARLDAFPKLPEFEKADERRRKKVETGSAHATRRTHVTGRTHATPRVAPMRPDSSEEPSIERERVMDDFDRAIKRWPVFDSPKAARQAWNKLAPDERIEAVDEIDRFVAINRSAGRKLICSLTRYLAERMWKAMPERPKPALASTSQPLIKRPSRFQLKRPDLYPELFGGNDQAAGSEGGEA